MEESTFRIIEGTPSQTYGVVEDGRSEGQKRHAQLLDDAEAALTIAGNALAEATDLLTVVMHVDSRAAHEIVRLKEAVSNHRRLKL